MAASAPPSNSQTNTGTISGPDLSVLMAPVHHVLTVGAGQESHRSRQPLPLRIQAMKSTSWLEPTWSQIYSLRMI